MVMMERSWGGVVSGFLYVGGRRVNGWQHWGESRGARKKEKQA